MTTAEGLRAGAIVALLCAAVLMFMPAGFALTVMFVLIFLSPFATGFARHADGGRFVVAALYVGAIGGLFLAVMRAG